MDCFYEQGLKFECTGCGYCCSSEPGYVFLSDIDAKRLTAATGLSMAQFLEVYCRKIDMGAFKLVSLKERENFDCIFLTEAGCSVYDARPEQCRTYPFWASIMENRENWDEEAKSCPGIGKGKIHTKREIDGILSSRRGNGPMMVD
ncbi:MAG: YkgJ family cysteine cluster protein [Sphaerochaetaceae bacterium]|jgi:Fe-S-cluster containining protein